MSKHPFRLAIESGSGRKGLIKLLAPDVALLTPIMTEPITGVDNVAHVLATAAEVASPIRYTLEASDSHQTFLMWNGHVRGHDLQAVTIIVDGDDGLIHEIRVLMRPWPVVTLFRDAMYDRLRDTVPAAYWELGTKADGPRSFTPIAMRPIEAS